MARDWLELAKNCYSTSTTYVDANYRKKWDDALRMFQSRHPADSKYNTEAYKHRSKIFRPKTRSMTRKMEAATAAAFFSNVDVISTSPMNADDPNQSASADVMKEIIQYRLTKSIPWFRILCGGMQDAQTIGIVCSKQYWKYKEREGESTEEIYLDEQGQPQIRVLENKEIIEDKPCIELIPAENIRFDPGADWTNPAESSPYIIIMMPMYVCDVKSQMELGDTETGKGWKKYTDAQIRSSIKNENDQTRQTRDQNKQSIVDQSNAPIGEYEIVWVHEYFVRIDSEEMVYYTLGTEFLLTDPVPIKEVYFTGERPIVIGTSIIETHKAIPESPILIAEQLQREANEIANQRLDNVKLVLNKRYIVKRGAQVDLKSLVRNVPASITLANSPTEDIKTLEYQDVTSSSYQEQDRLNVDYDELTGNFSQGSIMTNRKMGETVGGMGMISQAANQITEYSIRTFTETWVEPVLRQLVKLEQRYETDEVILALAAGKAKLMEKYGISQINDKLLNQELTLSVNVGMGATDPMAKLNKFIGALSAYSNVAQMQLPNVNMPEIGKEIFGLAGYRDGARFSMQNGGPEEQLAQMMQQGQQMAMQIQQLTEQLQKSNEQLQQAQSGQQKAMLEAQVKQQAFELQAKLDEQKMMLEYQYKERSSIQEDQFKREIADRDAAMEMEKATQEAEVALKKAAMDNNTKEDIAKLELVGKLQVAKINNEMEREDKEAEKEEPKPVNKKITITAPSGGVYTGTVEAQNVVLTAPSGGVYTGTLEDQNE